jgi:hypothetical protein
VNLAKLWLLKNDDEAARLIVTWEEASEWASRQNPPATDEQLHEEWSQLALVDPGDIGKLAPMLFRNGFIGPDGFVAEEALQFLQGLIASMMPTPKRPRSPAEG